jgi:hypothetical protein
MLWSTRSDSLRLLKRRFQTTDRLVKESFSLYDALIRRWDELWESGEPLERLSGLLTTKARYLAHGQFSLILDGYGQEAGALLRLQIECLQLLRYLRTDPTRADAIMERKRFPKAGVVAKANKGILRGLRGHLSEHASHVNLSYYSLRHGFDERLHGFREQPALAASTLNQNSRMLVAMNALTLQESAECLVIADEQALVDVAVALDHHVAQAKRILQRMSKESDGGG